MQTSTTDASRVICSFQELEDPSSRAFTIGAGDWPFKGFIVRQGDRVYAYVNRCPHAGHPLNWRPDAFLAPGNKLLLCSSHGALFDVASGHCVAGPCVGAALTPIAVEIRAGDVVIMATAHELAAHGDR